MKFHTQTIHEVLTTFSTTSQGLSSEEVERRLSKYGPNELEEKKKRSLVLMFLDQFRDFMIMVLLVAAIISGFIGEIVDTIAIVVIVVLNAVIGFVQEYRAEKAMAALRLMTTPTTTVIRGGEKMSIPSREVVPGDIVLLSTGMVIPADLRLIEVAHMKVDEAALTGESIPVDKHTSPLKEEKVPLGDMKNMAFKGTIVKYGRGTGVVVTTGMSTELGRIATMLQEEEDVKTPLQKRLVLVGQRLAITAIAICGIIFVAGILRGESPVLMFLTAVSLAVAAIPEALPAMITISLALGAMKMVKQNVLIRKLHAVETLGAVTYICTDKTGTITMNKMAVDEIYIDGRMWKLSDLKTRSIDEEPFRIFFRGLMLNNDAVHEKEGVITGDPTEVALLEAAEVIGYDKKKMDVEFPRVGEIPFDSTRKAMTTIHRVSSPEGERFISFTKGGAEVLIDKSRYILTSEGEKVLSRDELLGISEKMAADGLRVIAITYRWWDKFPDRVTPEEVEGDFTLIALAGIMDPPRKEAVEAVSLCKSAGITPVMITGDHPATAKAIARKVGIVEDSGEVVTGLELDRLSMEEFEERVKKIRVYARVAPEQKLKIVKALQDRGEYVAMTGDGVNDAPALKRADIGVAMGITGTDVAKEASYMILLDDNFATIVTAVKEGRKIYDNIRKFFKYLLTSNSAEIWTIFLAPFIGLPIPLLPIHILWINLVTDGAPSLALTVEPPESDVMSRPPRPPKESLFAGGMWQHILWVGSLMGAITLFTQAWSIKTGHSHWQTMVFTVLCLSQFGHVLAIRSEKESLFTQGLLSNKPLMLAVFFSFLLQLATIYIPMFNRVFKTQPLTAIELAFTLAMSSIVFFAVEIEKWLKRRYPLYESKG